MTSPTPIGNIRGPQGVKGDKGDQGDQGVQGNPGPPNTLSVASTSTGAPGTNASVSVGGTSPTQNLSFTIPRGDVGAQGEQGIQGPKGDPGTGIQLLGTVADSSELDPDYEGAVGDAFITEDTGRMWIWDGENWDDVGQIQGPEGPQGPQGEQGDPGPANTLSVTGTNTGSPGTNASVQISGTSPNQSLEFTIPRGDVGATGAAGADGPRGTGWFTGTGPPEEPIPGSIAGDLYLDAANGNVYVLEGASS